VLNPGRDQGNNPASGTRSVRRLYVILYARRVPLYLYEGSR
jgi:hypothetical protein